MDSPLFWPICLKLALVAALGVRLFCRFPVVAASFSSLFVGMAVCLVSCVQFDFWGSWPRLSLSWLVQLFEPVRAGWSPVDGLLSLLLVCLYFGVWYFYLDFCRALEEPLESSVKFCLLACLSMLASFLWLRAAIDYGRFRGAMNLRLEACRLTQQGRLPEAIACLDCAIARDPGQLDIAADLAELHLETGCCDRALFVLDRAVQLSPHRPRSLSLVYAQRGRFYLQIGRPSQARQDLRTALRWSPGNREIRFLLRQADLQESTR